MTCEVYQNHFRPVIEPNWNNAVSNAAAYDHVCVSRGIKASVILGKQSLIRRDQSTNQRQPELTAMRVSAEDQIYINALVALRRKNLQKYGRTRSDGKSLSRTAQLACGSKTDFLFVADSGPGETNAKGLIVPRFGKTPENHVSVSMSYELFSELTLMTKIHYQAWLTAHYLREPMKSSVHPTQANPPESEDTPNMLF